MDLKKHQNLAALFQLLSQDKDGHWYQRSDCNGFRLDHSCWPNLLFDVRFSAENKEERFAKWQGDIHKGIAPVVAQLGPNGPMAWRSFFENVAEAQNEWTEMRANLNSFEKPNYPPELKIRKVQSLSDWNQWHALLKRELLNNRPLNERAFYALASRNEVNYYMGFVQDTLVAVSMSFVYENEVGVYLVASHSDYRSMGYGSAITAEPMFEAQSIGVDYAWLQATKLGKPVYQKLGFDDLGPVYVFRCGTI